MRIVSVLTKMFISLLIVFGALTAGVAGDIKGQHRLASEGDARQYEIVLVEPSGRLRANHQQFWLYGVKLPRSAICRDARGNAWGCGVASFVRWSHLLGHGTSHCVVRDPSRVTWSCTINNEYAATTLLRKGWATRDTVSDSELDKAERFGREHGEGIWASAD